MPLSCDLNSVCKVACLQLHSFWKRIFVKHANQLMLFRNIMLLIM